MIPTEQLKTEHRAIERMLKIFAQIDKKLKAGQKIPADDLLASVEFIKVFADSCHHGKEEDLLFKELINTGMNEEMGPIAVMKAEHNQGRELVKKMKEGAEKYRSGKIEDAKEFVDAALSYSSLLEQHIKKEDEILYPMADKMLTQDIQSRLISEFDKLEEEKIGKGKHEEFHRLLDGLEKEYCV